MDWFERLTGFKETTYAETQARLSVADGYLRNERTGRRFGMGTLSLPLLSELRAEVAALPARRGRLRLSIVEGDVRAIHQLPENRRALFQVASQFNMLEMVGPDVTPEHGVTRYEHDRTQGPACAMAAGAALIYRNYLVPIAGGAGQTADRQLDGLADVGAVLAQNLAARPSSLWSMRNGYALLTNEGLAAVPAFLRSTDATTIDDLRGCLRVGLHHNVEVTDGLAPGPLVNQVFCSALPVAYGRGPRTAWEPFARLVLEAAYEATLLAGVLNVERGGTNRVLLTRLGGGAFGNDENWIDDAMLQAVHLQRGQNLDVVIVSYGPPSILLRDLIQQFGDASRYRS